MNVSQKTLLALSVALALGGCGGGGGSSTPSNSTSPINTIPNPPPADTPKTVASSGVITGFGSIFVNGLRYDTATAEVEFEGEGLMTEADLRLGMRVEVKASRNGDDRVATKIVFDKDLKGPVSLVTPDATNPEVGTLMVLGQIISVNISTVLDRNVGDVNLDGKIDLRDLDVPSGNVVVEISGFRTDAGFIATRIERESDDSDSVGEFEVMGPVSQLDITLGTFMISGLTIAYDASTDVEDFDDSPLANGQFVAVEGVLRDDGSLLAIEIEREDDGLDDDSEKEGEFEIAGVLSAVDVLSSPNTITVNGITIPVVDASPFLGKEGFVLEVEGEFEAGVLVIEAEGGINEEKENEIHVEDRIISLGDGSFTTQLGFTVTPTGTSRVEDEIGENGDRLKPDEFLARLQVSDVIEASGYLEEDGSVTWTRISRNESNDEGCELTGPVDAGSIDSSAGLFSIMGVTIDTNSIKDDEALEGITAAGRTVFFAELAAGFTVEAESAEGVGACSSNMLIAEEVAIDEDEPDSEDEDDGQDEDEDEDEDEDTIIIL